jgi:hypothetical protein
VEGSNRKTTEIEGLLCENSGAAVVLTGTPWLTPGRIRSEPSNRDLVAVGGSSEAGGA